MTKRQIPRFELAQVAQHLGLGVVRIEDRMREKFRFTNCGLRNSDWRLAEVIIGEIAHGRAAEDRHQQLDIVFARCFVEGNANCAGAKWAQIAVRFFRVFQNDIARFDFDSDCVEEILVRDLKTEPAQTISELAR